MFLNEREFVSEITKLAQQVIKKGGEGIVVRPATAFHYGHFEIYTGKYVRANHVQTDEHWRTQVLARNVLAK